MDIKEKRVEEVKVVYIPRTGTYDKIPEYIAELKQWIHENKLEMAGLVYGTYYNTPDEVDEEDLRYEIGFSVKGDIKAEGKVGVKDIPEHTVIAAIHQGPYTAVGPVIKAVVEYAVENNYDIVGPLTEAYLNDPNSIPDNEWLTEVRLPVIKIK